MKATEENVPVNFILYRVVLSFMSMDETIKMKATEQYFPLVLFIVLFKMVLT